MGKEVSLIGDEWRSCEGLSRYTARMCFDLRDQRKEKV